MSMKTYVVAADMFSDRVKGRLIRGKRGDKVEMDSDQADRFTEGDNPTLMSESDWEKRNEQTVKGLFESAPDSYPSGATAGIVTTGVGADVPSPESAARQRAEEESKNSDKDSQDDGGNPGTGQEDQGGTPGSSGGSADPSTGTTEQRSDGAAQQAEATSEADTKSGAKSSKKK